MKRAANVVIVILILSQSSCTKDGSPTNPSVTPPGAFSYTSYDSLGIVIVRGWFTLRIADSAHVTGEWHFTQIAGGSTIGPQVGDGNLEGGFHTDKLWVELNPQFVDHNCSLGGTYSDTAYAGTWQAIGIMGIYNYGTFHARRE
jgi:hypothetical protein